MTKSSDEEEELSKNDASGAASESTGANSERKSARRGASNTTLGAPADDDLDVVSNPVVSAAADVGPPSSRADSGNARVEAQIGDIIGDRYRLSSVLGRGGMGSVYAAEHVLLGKLVAVKLMHGRLANREEYLRRFRREARAASSVDHPNVVRVLDYGTHCGQPFLVMELAEGDVLSTWLLEQPSVPIASVISIVHQLLSGLEALHAAGIVHRDIKPSNIAIGNGPADELRVKVLDLGLAHFDDWTDNEATLTRYDVVAGTPDYMSPEQSRSLRVGPSSDLYAVGCILTELLQGAPPFQGVAPIDILSQHMYAPAPGLRRADSAEVVPTALERLRLDLLAKHPSRRPADAADAKRRLLAAIDPLALSSVMARPRSSVPPAARADRIPQWNNPKLGRAQSVAGPEVVLPMRIRVLRLTEDEDGLNLQCQTGLYSLGFELENVDPHSSASIAGEPAAIQIIDVGEHREAGLELIRRLIRELPEVDIVVCAAALGAEQVSAWIEAGAADTVPYPVGVDEVSRRLTRIAQRRARMQRRGRST